MFIGIKQPPLDSFNKLQPVVSSAFIAMNEYAKLDGYNLNIFSAYRNFDLQLLIWNKKYITLENELSDKNEIVSSILRYNALPGTSRHHWGTEIDIIGNISKQKDPLIEENYSLGGIYFELFLWLQKNASKFGFHLVYTNNHLRPGFFYEPWHFSYKSLSKPILNCFLNENWIEYIDKKMILGYEIMNEKFIMNYLDNYMHGLDEHLV